MMHFIAHSSETFQHSPNVDGENRACLQPENLVAIPTPKKSGAAKMAAVGAVQGTSMGSMAPLNTSSSVAGATTWFLSHTASSTYNLQD